MSRKNLIIAIIFMLLSALLLFVPQFHCEAAEQETVVTVPIEQLTTLEVELNRASKAIASSKVKSAELQQQLTELRTALAEAKQQSAKLREQLQASTVTLTLQQTQLANANESLTILSAEMKKEQRSLERQRNIAYIIASVCIYALVR